MLSEPSILSEKKLLVKISEGDEKSFRYLFDKYKHRIYSLSMYLTHSEYISEEITQEVFLKIWQSKERLLDIQCFNAYLRAIASHMVSNYLKRMANEQVIFKKISQVSTCENEETENGVIFNEYKEILKKAIENLPPQQRKVYILSRQQGFKQGDIAKIMNLSPYTVKKYMRKALFSVKEYIGNWVELSVIVASQIFFDK
jgi:RNA polymerase sigma-70 factor (ECF subfamily)